MSRPVPVGRKIVVYGPSGSGKSWLSEQLAAKLGSHWIELDAIFHGPGWKGLAPAEFRTVLRELKHEHSGGWVMDGNYHIAIEEAVAIADTIIWLDLPFTTVYLQLARRTLRRTFQRTELWNGNQETFRQTFLSRDSMLWWGIHAWSWSRERVQGAVSQRSTGVRVYRLRTPGQVRYLFQNATLDVPEPPSTPLPSGAPDKEADDANVPRW